MKARRKLGLIVVGLCAAVLSFSALYDLAVLCGFARPLAALVPILADAGAAVAADVWLDRGAPARARKYARVLALSLLGSSVLGNATGHALVAAGARPHWTVVVLVGALAPAVVGAVVHLTALVMGGQAGLTGTRTDTRTAEQTPRTGGTAEAVSPAPVPAVIEVRDLDEVTDPDRLAALSPDSRTGTRTDDEDEDVTGDDLTDDALVEQVVRWADSEGSVPSRERIRVRFRVGTGRAQDARRLAVEQWQSGDPDRSPDCRTDTRTEA